MLTSKNDTQEVLSDITSSFMSQLNKIASSSIDKLAKM